MKKQSRTEDVFWASLRLMTIKFKDNLGPSKDRQLVLRLVTFKDNQGPSRDKQLVLWNMIFILKHVGPSANLPVDCKGGRFSPAKFRASHHFQ